MGWQLKQYPLFSQGSSQTYDNLIILPLVLYMDDWLEKERKGSGRWVDAKQKEAEWEGNEGGVGVN